MGGMAAPWKQYITPVPTLTIPVFADQFNNAIEAEQQGYALKLSYNDKNFNEETLLAMIKEMLNNPKYSESAKLRSRLFHDRPNKPLDTAIYWIEYVIRHKGADHLKVFGRKLPWYQFYMVDVILFLISCIVLGLFVLYIGLKAVAKAFGYSNKVKVKRS